MEHSGEVRGAPSDWSSGCQESFAQPGKNWFYLLYSQNSI